MDLPTEFRFGWRLVETEDRLADIEMFSSPFPHSDVQWTLTRMLPALGDLLAHHRELEVICPIGARNIAQVRFSQAMRTLPNKVLSVLLKASIQAAAHLSVAQQYLTQLRVNMAEAISEYIAAHELDAVTFVGHQPIVHFVTPAQPTVIHIEGQAIFDLPHRIITRRIGTQTCFIVFGFDQTFPLLDWTQNHTRVLIHERLMECVMNVLLSKGSDLVN